MNKVVEVVLYALDQLVEFLFLAWVCANVRIKCFFDVVEFSLPIIFFVQFVGNKPRKVVWRPIAQFFHRVFGFVHEHVNGTRASASSLSACLQICMKQLK